MQFAFESLTTDVAVVRGEGRLNMVSAPTLREVVKKAIGTGRSHIVVDLSRIVFMDSSGLGALVGCLKSARQAGGDLRIAAPTAQVMTILRMSQIDRVIASYDSAEDAYRT
jgi:anti-sigma B factor antagonist